MLAPAARPVTRGPAAPTSPADEPGLLRAVPPRDADNSGFTRTAAGEPGVRQHGGARVLTKSGLDSPTATQAAAARGGVGDTPGPDTPAVLTPVTRTAEVDAVHAPDLHRR